LPLVAGLAYNDSDESEAFPAKTSAAVWDRVIQFEYASLR
jgi:hypothetical protein